MIDYKLMAREALDRAKRELETGDPTRVSYAALEVRNAIEAVAYERALSYGDKMPPLHKEWTPQALLAFLAELDPEAEIATSSAAAKQQAKGPSSPGQGPSDEPIFTHTNLKTAYDKLESDLHLTAPGRKFVDRRHDGDDLLSFCQSCIDLLDKVLASDFWGVQSAVFASCKCARCGAIIMKRLDDSESTTPLAARCIECGASHTVTLGKGEAIWEPNLVEIPCGSTNCKVVFCVWSDEVERGLSWVCPKCANRWVLELAACKLERRLPESEEASATR